MFQTDLSGRTQNLINSIFTQFRGRAYTEAKKQGVQFGIDLDIKISADSRTLWLYFKNSEDCHVVNIPLPFIKDDITFIEQNGVCRALCPFWFEETQEEFDYLVAIYSIVLAIPNGFVSNPLVKATPYLQQVINGFKAGNAYIVIHKLQRAINEVVSKMPLHETDMNSFIMNNRLIIVDPKFDELRSPTDQLTYQVEKARKYFNKGWTSIGLSDGSLASKNYILRFDLRAFTPFGNVFHNPQRNLYSTLGMQGDELPIIRSQSMEDLINKDITRTGWNLFTAFVDIPDNFEDQIVLDYSMAKKFVTADKRMQVFGNVTIKQGDHIKVGDILGYSPDYQVVRFTTPCESAMITEVEKIETNVGGQAVPVHNITIEFKRYFRDGFKITNLHGNKGIIHLADLGFAIDPITGEHVKIDVMVSAKTTGKRKNYGQILEALFSNIIKVDKIPTPVVIEDDWYQDIEEIYTNLENRGFPSDGMWSCDTYAGKVRAVCGKVFWGCIKTPQDQVWKKGATSARNNKDIRTAGLKFSHVEMRALATVYGDENPIADEVMSYMQGTENLNEVLIMNATKMGKLPFNKPTLSCNEVTPVNQTVGTMLSGIEIDGTVIDEFFEPEGFIMTLPLPYQTVTDSKGGIIHEGPPLQTEMMTEDQKSFINETFTINSIYVPAGILRKCWRHDSARYGLSEIGVLINNMVILSRRIMADITSDVAYRMYYWALTNYFTKISNILCSKRGEISTFAMAVRYPFSVKATASLTTVLPKNVVEIHNSMADILNVKDGDIVLCERFPCLGFVSVRAQKVKITDDPQCEYVIRASNNSLVSQNLDFDGDVIYLASFHSQAAVKALEKEFNNPNQTCHTAITFMNERKGAPHIKEFSLRDHKITPFAKLTNEQHAMIVEKNTGVKAQTGPVIALTYNIMRMVENSPLGKHQKDKVAIELFLEKAAQSVFEQKHGGTSLYEIVIEGVCTADVERLVEVGFKRGITEKICELVTHKAASVGVFDLKAHHAMVKDGKASNIVSLVIRQQNLIYFASRATIENTLLAEMLKSEAIDIPSKMFKWATSGKAGKDTTEWDTFCLEREMKNIENAGVKDATKCMCDILEQTLHSKHISRKDKLKSVALGLRQGMVGGYVHR